MHIGDVRTKNILVTKSEEIKLVNVASFPSERTSVEKVLDGFDNTTVFYFGNSKLTQLRRKSIT